MFPGSYVYRRGRSSIGYLIATPQAVLPTIRASQPCIPIDQTFHEPHTLLRGSRLSNTSYLIYRSYCVFSKAEGTQLVKYSCSPVQLKVAEDQWLPPVDNQPTVGPEKQYQHISTTKLRALQFASTLENPDRPLSEEFGEQFRRIQRVDALNNKFQRHREIKDLKDALWKKRSTWSQDWQVPLGLLKLHYQAEHEEEFTVLGRPLPVWSSPRNSIRQVRADQILRPQMWSVISFGDYVDDLTRSTVDRLVQHQIYGNKKSHVEAVAQLLERLFGDAGMKSFLSVKACNIALRFFYDKDMFSKARALYTRMEKLHLKLEPETFDIILRGSAANKDLHNYTYHLQNMIKRGCKPSPRTWSSLLMAVNSSEARASIVQAMRERKMLKGIPITRDVVNLTIRDDVAKHLNGREEMSVFFTAMDTRYAPGWLTVTATNVILDEVCMRRSAWEAFELLNEIRKRVPRLNRVTLNTLLAHCSRLRAHELTIDVLDFFELKHGIIPTQKEYQVLFKQAWRSRLYNFAKVIWRSACMDAVVTFTMKELVIDSLKFKIPDWLSSETKSRADIWKAAAGEVIVGIGLAAKEINGDDVPRSATILPKTMQGLNEGNEKLAGCLNQLTDHKNVPRQRPQMKNIATSLYRSDLTAFQKWQMERKLGPLLREALAMDREWAKGNWRDISTEWKRRNAITVEVRPAGLVHKVFV